MSLQRIIIMFVILLLIIVSTYANYCWTKSSLEDIAGKEVKPETVIWTMMKTQDRK